MMISYLSQVKTNLVPKILVCTYITSEHFSFFNNPTPPRCFHDPVTPQSTQSHPSDNF